MPAAIRQHTIPTPYMVGDVHCYSLETDEGLVLFDCGPPTGEALASLRSQVDLSRLKYLFLTHCHIDHYGLAGRVAAISGAKVLVPRADALKLRHRARCLNRLASMLSEIGCEAGLLQQMRERSENDHCAIGFPSDFEIVEESELPAALGIEVLSCPGHSQSDIVYLHGKEAVTGDVLLRNIFQVPILEVDLGTFSGRFRNYDAYCKSLLSLQRLRGCRILPGHRDHIDNLNATILFYVGRLLARAEQIRKQAAAGSVMEIFKRLFGDRLKNPFFVHMKISEIVFALDFLADPGRLRHTLETVGMFEAVAPIYRRIEEGDKGDRGSLDSAA